MLISGIINLSVVPGNGEEAPSKEEEAFQRKVKEMSGHMFTVMWHVTELDIVSTITEVCFKVDGYSSYFPQVSVSMSFCRCCEIIRSLTRSSLSGHKLSRS